MIKWCQTKIVQILAALSVMPMFLAPTPAMAWGYGGGCCPPVCEDNCCDPCYRPRCGWFNNSNLWCWGGAALLGAAAGAGVGYAVAHHQIEEHEEDFLDPFLFDAGRSLTFSITVTNLAGVAGTAIPFVSEPNGVVVEGATTAFPAAGATVFAVPVITNPIFGTYTVGIHVVTGTLGIGTSGSFTVFASRDGTTTTVLLPTTTVALPALGQYSGEFTYDQTNIP